MLNQFVPPTLKSHSPEAVYQKFIGTSLPGNSVFIVVGTDGGCILDYVSKHFKTGQRFIFVERSDVLELLRQNLIPRLPIEFQEKIECMEFEQFKFEHLYNQYHDYVVRNASIILKSFSVEDDVNGYRHQFQVMQQNFQKFSVDRADNRDFQVFYNSQFKNVCDFMHPIMKLQNRLDSEIPVLVLGGGPSLDKVLPWLKKNQSKVWIFAAARIGKRLQAENITPDFVGTIDFQELSFDYSKESLSFYQKSILLTGNSPSHTLLSQWRGLKTFCRQRFPWSRQGEVNYFSEGPTIGNALVGMAIFLGGREIYLSGIDLCFSKEGKTHESGSVEAESQNAAEASLQVVNYLGHEVDTNVQLYDARNNFIAQVRSYRENCSGLSIFNTNSEAAVIDGVGYRPIEQVPLLKEKFQVVEQFNELLPQDKESTRAYINALLESVKTYSKWLYSIAREAEAGRLAVDKLFNEPAKQEQRIKKIIKLKTNLEKSVGDDYQIFVNYARNAFTEGLGPVESQTDMSREEIVQSLNGFFGGLEHAASHFLLKMDEIRQEILFRQEEFNRNTQFERLVQRWIEQGVPGRFYIWLDHFATEKYDFYKRNFPALVKSIEGTYERLIQNDERLKQNQALKSQTSDWFFEMLTKKANEQDRSEVEALHRQLKSMNQEKVRIALSYSKGLILELEGKLEEALDWYTSIDPAYSNFHIQQRVYPLAFQYGRFEMGLLSLEKLCQVSVRFLPQYANALDVMGNVEGAIATLEHYPLLNKDTLANLDLIRFYIQSGRLEEAKYQAKSAESNVQLDQPFLKTKLQELQLM